MKKSIVISIALAIFFLLGFFTIFGQRGFLHLRNLEIQLSKIENDNFKLASDNTKMRNEIDLLKKNVQFIEDIARKELGLIKPNELVYHLEESHAADANTH